MIGPLRWRILNGPILTPLQKRLSRLYRGISGGLLGGRLLAGALTAAATTSLVEHVSPPSEVLFLEAGEESPPAPFDVPNYTVENRLHEDCTNFCYKVLCNIKSGQKCVCCDGDKRDQSHAKHGKDQRLGAAFALALITVIGVLTESRRPVVGISFFILNG